MFFLIAFFSEVLGTMAGFGSSTIFLPLALLFVDFKTALVLVAFLHIFGNIGRISFFRHGLDKQVLIVFGIPSIILTLVGAFIVNYVSQDALKGLLGVFLLIYSVLFLWKEELKITPSLSNSII